MTGTDMPLVSVIMPAYNAEKYIAEAIKSVIAQTYENWELIVIDDCSKDKTAEIAEKFAEKDGRIRLIKNIKNIGAAETRNKGLDLAKGAYIALLDSDDIWLSEKTEKQLELAQQTEADIVYCSYALIDENGEKCCEDFIVPATTDLDHMLVSSVISCSTALISSELMKERRFTAEFFHEDYVMWLSLMKEGCSAEGLTDVLASYRIIGKSRSSNKLNSALNRWYIYREYLELPLAKSALCFCKYGFSGIKKYSRKKRNEY